MSERLDDDNDDDNDDENKIKDNKKNRIKSSFLLINKYQFVKTEITMNLCEFFLVFPFFIFYFPCKKNEGITRFN